MVTKVLGEPIVAGFVCYFCDRFIPKGNDGFINFDDERIVHPLHCEKCNKELRKDS